MIQGAPFGKQIAPIQECCLAEPPVSLLLSPTLLMPPLGGARKVEHLKIPLGSSLTPDGQTHSP